MSKIIPNPSFNEWITDVTNCEIVSKRKPIYKKQREFLHRAYEINVKRQNYFSKFDFLGMTDGNFRQYILQLKKYIVKAFDSRPAFYNLKGISVDNLTINHTVLDSVSKEFENILKELKHQPPFIHDIRIETLTSGLYERLVKLRIPNKKNMQITLNIPLIDSRFKTKVSISRNGRLLVMLGCTQKPLPYSNAGFDDLIEYLTKVAIYLMSYSQTDYVYTQIRRWKIVYYHFNKDGKTIQSPMFKYCIEDLQEHSRIYAHDLDNGEKVLRWEKTLSMNTTIEEEQKKAALTEEKRKENEWFDDETPHTVEFKKGNEYRN